MSQNLSVAVANLLLQIEKVPAGAIAGVNEILISIATRLDYLTGTFSIARSSDQVGSCAIYNSPSLDNKALSPLLHRVVESTTEVIMLLNDLTTAPEFKLLTTDSDLKISLVPGTVRELSKCGITVNPIRIGNYIGGLDFNFKNTDYCIVVMFTNTTTWDKLEDIIWNLSLATDPKPKPEPSVSWLGRVVSYFK